MDKEPYSSLSCIYTMALCKNLLVSQSDEINWFLQQNRPHPLSLHLCLHQDFQTMGQIHLHHKRGFHQLAEIEIT
jgi:hypothetical protein